MVILINHALSHTALTAQNKNLIALFIAAFSGLAWFTIFTRWAYRHKVGRAGELTQETQLSLYPDYICLQRGQIETRINWVAVKEIQIKPKFTLLKMSEADPLIIPDRWFNKDVNAKTAFIRALTDYKARASQ